MFNGRRSAHWLIHEALDDRSGMGRAERLSVMNDYFVSRLRLYLVGFSCMTFMLYRDSPPLGIFIAVLACLNILAIHDNANRIMDNFR